MKPLARYRYLQDPGHGWIEVPRDEITALGIAYQVSKYSYQNGGWVYLEEDCDAGLWISARDAAGYPVSPDDPTDKHVNADSLVRSFDRYRPTTDLRAQTTARLTATITGVTL